MAVQSSSLTFSAENQDLYRDTSETVRIDTGDSLVASFDYSGKIIDVSAFLVDIEVSAYLNVAFGLQPWIELGTTGTWSAEYELDVNVELPNAVIIPAYEIGTPLRERSGAMMEFDFSDYEILRAEVETVGFNTDDEADPDPGARTGLDLITTFQAGISSWEVDGPIPYIGFCIPFVGCAGIDIDEFSGGRIPFFDIDIDPNLITVEPGAEEFRPSNSGIAKFAKLFVTPAVGAETSGSSKGENNVTARGSAERFFGIEGDVDRILLEAVEKVPVPQVQAVAETLRKTIFYENSLLNLGISSGVLKEAIDLIAKIDVTMLDLTGGIGVSLEEEFSLDITDEDTGLPDVYVTLEADNGKTASGKLGDTLTLESPKQNFGTNNITATYTLGDAQATHRAALGLDAFFNVSIFSAEVEILGKKLGGFGPLIDEDVVSVDIGQAGEAWEDTYTVSGEVFGTQTDTFSVFYVEDRLLPEGLDPDLPSFEASIYGFFEAAYAQVQAALDAYPVTGYDNVRPANANPPASLTINYSSFPGSTLHVWTGAYNENPIMRDGSGSRVLVAPTQSGFPLAVTIKEQVGSSLVTLQGPTTSESGIDAKLNLLELADRTDVVLYSGNGKFLETGEVTDHVGSAGGDLMLYHFDSGRVSQGGTYFDGGRNLNGTTDLFVANLGSTTQDIEWDLAQAMREEQDGDAATMGGVILKVSETHEITVRNAEAAFLTTGSGDDYLVGSVYSDGFITGAGDDIVRLTSVFTAPGSAFNGRLDIDDDYVRLGAGRDTAILAFSISSTPAAAAHTDYIFGGTGADHLYLRNGNQGLRYDFKLVSSTGANLYAFGGDGIGYDADHDFIDAYLQLFTEEYDDNFGGFEETGRYAQEHYLLINGSDRKGRIEIAKDVEYVNIYTAEAGTDAVYGGGNDLVVFMNGKTYDGGRAPTPSPPTSPPTRSIP